MDRFIVLAPLILMAGACDRQPAAAPVQPGAAGEPAKVAPAADGGTTAAAPATQPLALMLIDEKRREFPPPKLIMQERNGKTVVLLMSDDPPDAINDDYTGNSYYLEMEFDERLASVRGQQWLFEAPSTDRLDSPNGIFLEGNRSQLQPFQVKVQFPADGSNELWISGTFYQFTHPKRTAPDDPGENRAPPPKLVVVAGRLVVDVP